MEKHKELPDIRTLAHTELELCTYMALQYTAKENKKIEQQSIQTHQEKGETYQCITCQKTNHMQQYITIRRANKPQCGKPRLKEKENRKQFPNQEFEETSKTSGECRKRQKHRCRKKQKRITKPNNKKNKTNRRTIQGRGTPPSDETLYRNRIRYDVEENKWICNTCNKKYEPKNQQNAIQHSRKHFQKPKEK